jgi:dihydropteroate synthase
MIFRVRSRVIAFPRRPLIMGIVNINDDSFSGDGSLDIDSAIQAARLQTIAGADIIDVGGESARTNRGVISITEEISRLTPFVQRFAEVSTNLAPMDSHQLFPPLLSINAWRPLVAEAVLSLGGDLLNDISGLPVDDNARIAARYKVGLVVMHTVGEPKQKHTHVRYQDIIRTLEEFFERKIEIARSAGLGTESILLDPGIDFAKQKEDNLRIYQELGRLDRFKRPILLPVSRKTVIGEVLKINHPKDRDAGTVACVVAGALRGASIFRVHNVEAASQVLRVIDPILREKTS